MSTKQHQPDGFEELYLKERKKSQILLVVAIVLALVTTGSLIWGISKQSNNDSSQLPGGGPNGGFNGQGGFRGGGLGMGMDIKSFFKDDGSLDTDKVDELTSRFPSGADSRFVDLIKEQANQAVEDGDITQDQADALIEKIESDADTTSSDSSLTSESTNEI